MRRVVLCFVAACGSSKVTTQPATGSHRDPPPGALRTVDDFVAVRNRSDRSRAMFVEAARVFMHPRCVNCHPAGDTPHQGMRLALHDPPVVRGSGDSGVPGMECTTCHQDRNQQLTRVPGAPMWHLAPIQMAWVGKSVSYICNQLKDPARNGGKTLAQIADHAGHDELVAWGWSPGADREAAPGTQQQFGALVAAWVETGAECPTEAP